MNKMDVHQVLSAILWKPNYLHLEYIFTYESKEGNMHDELQIDYIQRETDHGWMI